MKYNPKQPWECLESAAAQLEKEGCADGAVLLRMRSAIARFNLDEREFDANPAKFVQGIIERSTRAGTPMMPSTDIGLLVRLLRPHLSTGVAPHKA